MKRIVNHNLILGMKRLFLLTLLTLFLLTTTAFATTPAPAKNFIWKTVTVEEYTRLVVSNIEANVVYINNPDSVGFLNIRGEESIMDKFKISVKDSVLNIKNPSLKGIDNSLLMIYIYSPKIKSIDLTGGVVFETYEPLVRKEMDLSISGGSQIIINKLDCETLKVSLLTGSGDVLVKGTASEAKYSIIGGGEIRADAMSATNVKASLKGNGNIGCYAVKNLKVSIMGSGNIYFRGKPEIKSTIIGTGNVKSLD